MNGGEGKLIQGTDIPKPVNRASKTRRVRCVQQINKLIYVVQSLSFIPHELRLVILQQHH